jgi:hypothetical protein
VTDYKLTSNVWKRSFILSMVESIRLFHPSLTVWNLAITCRTWGEASGNKREGTLGKVSVLRFFMTSLTYPTVTAIIWSSLLLATCRMTGSIDLPLACVVWYGLGWAAIRPWLHIPYRMEGRRHVTAREMSAGCNLLPKAKTVCNCWRCLAPKTIKLINTYYD